MSRHILRRGECGGVRKYDHGVKVSTNWGGVIQLGQVVSQQNGGVGGARSETGRGSEVGKFLESSYGKQTIAVVQYRST